MPVKRSKADYVPLCDNCKLVLFDKRQGLSIRAMASKAGWYLSRDNQIAYCPNCRKEKRK